jgi:hypothetical protein
MVQTFGPEKYAPADQRPAETLVSGPERFAPPAQRPTEPVKLVERAPPTQWTRKGPDETHDFPAEKLTEIVQRATNASTNEIDLVIRSLDAMREKLRKESERVSGEIANYVSLSRSTTMSMKVITDSLKQWQDMP